MRLRDRIKDKVKEIFIMNDVWLKIAQFLGTLNGENIKRESYVRIPEYEAALEAWKETEQEWEMFLKPCLQKSRRRQRK